VTSLHDVMLVSESASEVVAEISDPLLANFLSCCSLVPNFNKSSSISDSKDFNFSPTFPNLRDKSTADPCAAERDDDDVILVTSLPRTISLQILLVCDAMKFFSRIWTLSLDNSFRVFLNVETV